MAFSPMNVPLTLLYHAVAPLPKRRTYLERALFVEPRDFAQQMDHLAGNGYRTLTLTDYMAATESRIPAAKRFLLTFDDGYRDVDRYVTPVLERHRYSAVMFVPWAHLGAQNGWDRGHPNLSQLRIMTPDHVKALDRGHWEIASHGGSHVDLRAENSTARRQELSMARDSLSNLLQREVTALAYPYGYHDAGVREDARRAGFTLAFTATGYGPFEQMRIPRRPIAGWDRLPLFILRIASFAAPLYRFEDLARVPMKLRHIFPTRQSSTETY